MVVGLGLQPDLDQGNGREMGDVNEIEVRAEEPGNSRKGGKLLVGQLAPGGDLGYLIYGTPLASGR